MNDDAKVHLAETLVKTIMDAAPDQEDGPGMVSHLLVTLVETLCANAYGHGVELEVMLGSVAGCYMELDHANVAMNQNGNYVFDTRAVLQ